MIGDKRPGGNQSVLCLCKEQPDPINMALSLAIVVCYGYLDQSGNLSM